jgi:hypothetical protein
MQDSSKLNHSSIKNSITSRERHQVAEEKFSSQSILNQATNMSLSTKSKNLEKLSITPVIVQMEANNHIQSSKISEQTSIVRFSHVFTPKSSHPSCYMPQTLIKQMDAQSNFNGKS